MSVKEWLEKYKMGESHTLPYRFFSDAGVLQAEREKIFQRDWQFVGHTSQVQNPGEFFTCVVGGEPIIVVRGEDQVLRAFYNICPHRATQLETQERGKRKILQCMYHGWTFKLDGKLNQAPNFRHQEGTLCEMDTCLRSVRLETEFSLIFINLDDNAAPLKEKYKDFLEDFQQFSFISNLKLHNQYTRMIKANWKAYVDNYLECDHCPIAHPGFVDALDLKTYEIINKEACTIQGAPIKQTAQFGEVKLNEMEVQEGRYYWLWPNQIFSITPGPGNLATTVLMPIDEHTTMAVFAYYFVNSEPTPEQQEMIKFVEQVRKEDIELVERAQVGFRSQAFKRGYYSPTEHALRHFHVMVHEALDR